MYYNDFLFSCGGKDDTIFSCMSKKLLKNGKLFMAKLLVSIHCHNLKGVSRSALGTPHAYL